MLNEVYIPPPAIYYAPLTNAATTLTNPVPVGTITREIELTETGAAATFGRHKVCTLRRNVQTRTASAAAPEAKAPDELLDLDGMSIVGHGTAFSLDDPDAKVPVAKTWRSGGFQGKIPISYLVEGVDYKAVQPKLAPLPKAKRQAALELKPSQNDLLCSLMPEAPVKAAGAARPMLLASSENVRNDAFVLDYDLDNGMSIPDSEEAKGSHLHIQHKA